MGAGTLINDRTLQDTKPASKPGRSLDLPLLVTVIALVIFGLVMMFSASWDYSLSQYGSPMATRPPGRMAFCSADKALPNSCQMKEAPRQTAASKEWAG